MQFRVALTELSKRKNSSSVNKSTTYPVVRFQNEENIENEEDDTCDEVDYASRTPEFRALTQRQQDEATQEEKEEAQRSHLQAFDMKNIRNPDRVFQECRLRCHKKHPFSSLAFCEHLIFKHPNEIKDIVKSPSVRACTRCLIPESAMRKKHTALNCPTRSHRCAVCVF